MIDTTDAATTLWDGGRVNPRRTTMATGVAFVVRTLTVLGCAHYEEAPPGDPAAMPSRPEAAAETRVGVIAGEVRVESPAASLTVAFETVGLFQDGKLLATSSTDGHGKFRFEKSGPGIYGDGLYDLTLISDRYRGSTRIQYARLAQRTYTLRATPRGSP